MADLLALDPEVRRRVEALGGWARTLRLPYTITSGFRSPATQRRLWLAWIARGRTGLPAARPGFSTHEYGFAVDLVPERSSDLPAIVELAQCAGLVWAGRIDPVHFDAFGFSGWARLLAGRPFTPRYRC